MATKTPSKGKKAGPEKVKSAPKKASAKKAPPAEAHDEDEAGEGGEGDEDFEDDDLEDEAPKPAAAAPAKKPAAPAAKRKAAAQGDDAPQVVPARRLTPEAKAKINELVAKGMPLGDALRAAASWETFVAPVREEPAKLVQGRSFEGGHPGPRPPREKKEEGDDDETEESIGGADSGDDD